MKTKTLILSCVMLLLLVIPAFGEDNIRVYVDGAEVSFPDQRPYVNSDSRTMVPVRFVSEALGAQVDWDEQEKTVKIKQGSKDVSLRVGDKKARVNASDVALDTSAALANSRTMVPLRFVSECLGAGVEWDGYKRAVYITRLDKPVTPFAGTPMDEKTFKTYGGRPIYGSNKPGAQYMYVTVDQLPVKFGDETIYSITPGEKVVAVKQASPGCGALQMLIIQDGVVIGSRNDRTYEANPFTAMYDTQDQTDVALGRPRVDLAKVNAFAFTTFKDIKLIMLVIKNPLYKGDWRP